MSSQINDYSYIWVNFYVIALFYCVSTILCANSYIIA